MARRRPLGSTAARRRYALRRAGGVQQGSVHRVLRRDKSNITPEAATVLDSAVTAYGNCDVVPIMLAGYTDRSGTERYNMGLSTRRNDSVRGYLTSKGILRIGSPARRSVKATRGFRPLTVCANRRTAASKSPTGRARATKPNQPQAPTKGAGAPRPPLFWAIVVRTSN